MSEFDDNPRSQSQYRDNSSQDRALHAERSSAHKQSQNAPLPPPPTIPRRALQEPWIPCDSYSENSRRLDSTSLTSRSPEINADSSYSPPYDESLTRNESLKSSNYSYSEVEVERTTRTTSNYDNFYTPSNESFYSAHPYSSLNRERREIRLLKVFRRRPAWKHFEANQKWDQSSSSSIDSTQSLIACEFLKTALSDVNGTYNTISYCAGDPRKTAVILVNGVPFNAFASLEQAIECVLSHRSSAHPGKDSILLWVDQICINQSDKDERWEQVQLMRDIYRQSKETFVFLSSPKVDDCLSWIPRVPNRSEQGSKSNRSEESMGVISLKNLLLDYLVGKGKGGSLRLQLAHPTMMTAAMMEADGIHPSDVNNMSGQLTTLQPHHSIRVGLQIHLAEISAQNTRLPGRVVSTESEALADMDFDNSAIASPSAFQESLTAFITNNWWRRSWVYQEFLSASSIHFISGPSLVPWSELSPLVHFISHGLDDFIESIRLHFESQITEEMKTKYRERCEKKRERKDKGKKTLWEREQRQVKSVFLDEGEEVLPIGVNASVEELGAYNDEAISSHKELPFEQLEMQVGKLDAHEIERRDTIARLQAGFRQLDRVTPASMAKGKATFKRSSDLIPLLQHSRNCEASDPRDRVYAFLGLAHSKYNLIPYYGPNNKLEMVLIDVAKSILQCENSLDILQHAHRGRKEVGVSIPSWVPDWTSKEINSGLEPYILNGSRSFDAAKGAAAVVEFKKPGWSGFEDRFYEDLKVKGIFVGTIEIMMEEMDNVSSFVLSTNEWILGPKLAFIDDEVWVLLGCTRPVVLRPESDNTFAHLGDALVYDKESGAKEDLLSPIMFGQMIDKVQERVAEVKDIWII